MNLKEKLNQFIIDIQGQFIEVSDRKNIYQCYDLAALWVIALGIPKSTIQHLYAYEVYTKPNANTKDYFDLIPNTSSFIPIDGDIGVFDKIPGNIAGHIGVYLGGGTTKSAMLFNQNNPLGTNAHVASYDYDNPKLLGVLRPKNQTSGATVPSDQINITAQTKIPQIDNMEVQAISSSLKDLKKDNQSLKNAVRDYQTQVEVLNNDLGRLADDIEKYKAQQKEVPAEPKTPVKTLPDPSFTIAGYNVYFIKNTE